MTVLLDQKDGENKMMTFKDALNQYNAAKAAKDAINSVKYPVTFGSRPRVASVSDIVTPHWSGHELSNFGAAANQAASSRRSAGVQTF